MSAELELQELESDIDNLKVAFEQRYSDAVEDAFSSAIGYAGAAVVALAKPPKLPQAVMGFADIVAEEGFFNSLAFDNWQKVKELEEALRQACDLYKDKVSDLEKSA